MNTDLLYIGKNKHRIYTVPDGDYEGFLQNGFCYLYSKEGVVFYRFQSTVTQKNYKVIEVNVNVKLVTAKIYVK